MALPRFYINDAPAGDKAVLDKEQSRHLAKVLRLKTGDRVELFDKAGNSYEAQIISISESVQLKILNQISNSQSAIRNWITLATAIPKGNRMDWLVEKCAELGLNKLIPMETKRSVVKDCGQAKINRWKKIAIESNKQCHQQYLMEISEILPFNKIIGSIEETVRMGVHPGGYDIKILASPEGEPLKKYVIRHAESFVGHSERSEESQETLPPKSIRGQGDKLDKNRIIYLIGPEGDFTQDEVNEAKNAGFKAVQMPVGGILRVETAAAAMLAMLKYIVSWDADERRFTGF
jgi:16S rRNA (uracil1498-N3)-methyltransferase